MTFDAMTATDEEISAQLANFTSIELTDPGTPTPAAEELPDPDLAIDKQVDPAAADVPAEQLTTEKVEEEIVPVVPGTETPADFEAQITELMAPLTANGKQYIPESVAEMRRLAQQGLGFNKKMAAHKADRKIVEMLKENGVFDETTLSMLIDVHKKNPKAIGKLLADSDIDPLNLEPSDDYTPSSYTVSDGDIALRSVLDDLTSSSHGADMLNTVVPTLDTASKQLLAEHPENLRILATHYEDGTYTKVMDRVERMRAVGDLGEMNDLQAYQMVGADMHAKGMLGNKPAAKATAVIPPVPKAAADQTEKRRAASAPKPAVSTTTAPVASSGIMRATDDAVADLVKQFLNN